MLKMELLLETPCGCQQDTMPTYTIFLQTVVQRSEPWRSDSEYARLALYGAARAALRNAVAKLIADPPELREVSRPGLDVVPCFEFDCVSEEPSEAVHLYAMQLGKGFLYDSSADPAWTGLEDITRVWVDLKDIIEGSVAVNDLLRPRTYCLVD